MACGCSDEACNCVVQGNGDVVVSGTGTAGDPYIVTHDETVFAAVENDGINIIPGGPFGHEPEFELVVDPDSTADVTLGPDGLRVDIPTGDPVPQAAFHAGMMMEWGGTTATVPDLWLPCDGSLQLTATYPDLFAAIAHEHNGGADPGGGQFRLPDARKRPTYGPGTGDSVGDLDGAYGSESALGKTHSHTADGTLAAASNTTGITIGNENNTQTGVGGGATQAVWDDVATASGNPGAINEISVAAGGADGNHQHGVTDGGHTHDVTGSTATASSPYLIVEKIIFAGV